MECLEGGSEDIRMTTWAKKLWADFGAWLCRKGQHRWVCVVTTEPATKDSIGCTLSSRICVRCKVHRIDQAHYRTLYDKLDSGDPEYDTVQKLVDMGFLLEVKQ